MNRRLVIIRDETLRDGSQQCGLTLSSGGRFSIAELSAKLLNSSQSTVNNQIDLGMPEVSSSIAMSIADISYSLRSYNIDFFVTGRSTREAIDIMISCFSKLPPKRYVVAPFLGISKLHRQKIGVSKKGLFAKIKEAVNYARRHAERIHFPLEGGFDAYSEDNEYLLSIFKLLSDLKVEAVVFCDTNGIALPFSNTKRLSYGKAISVLRKKFPEIEVSVHCHNDFGLAVANSIDGLLGGASIVDGTYLGLGERAGNASIETIITLLSQKKDVLEFEVQSNIEVLYETSRSISELLGVPIPDNYPVVGKNVFSHGSGIHQDGTLKNAKTYEPYNPKTVGREGHKIELSYLSGKKGIKHYVKEKYGIELDLENSTKVLEMFKEEIDRGDKMNLDEALLKVLKSKEYL